MDKNLTQPLLSGDSKAKLEEMTAGRKKLVDKVKSRLDQLNFRHIHEISDETVDCFELLKSEEKELRKSIASLKSGFGLGYDDDIRTKIAKYERDLDDNLRDYTDLDAKTKGALLEASIARLAVRKLAAQREKELEGYDAEKLLPSDQDQIIASLLKDGLIKEGAGHLVQKGKSYVALPNSEAVQFLYNGHVGLWAAVREARKDRSESYIAEVSEHVMSEENYEEAKDSKDTTRNLTEFLNGKGVRCFVPVHLQNRQSGDTRFAGEAILKRDDHGIFCGAVSPKSHRLAHLLFFFRRTAKGKEVRVHKEEINVEVVVDGGKLDLSGVKPFVLREAMERKLERDGESEEKKQIAEELRDVSRIENPLTMDDLLAGDSEGICPVDVTLKDGDRRIPLTFHLEGSGKRTFRLLKEVPGTSEKHDFVKAARAWQRVGVLNSEEWKPIRAGNRRFEFKWRLDRAAREHKATFVSKENANDLLGSEGRDGVYALRSEWWQEGDRTNLAYIIERNSSSLKVVWSLPGMSAKIVGEETSGEITDLPRMLRAVLRNSYIAIFSGKDNRRVEVPEHLLAPPRDGSKAEAELSSDGAPSEPVQGNGIEVAPSDGTAETPMPAAADEPPLGDVDETAKQIVGADPTEQEPSHSETAE